MLYYLGFLIFILWGIVETINIFLMSNSFFMLRKRQQPKGNIIVILLAFISIIIAFAYGIIT